VNDESESCYGGEGCSPGCDCACGRAPAAEELNVREATRAGGTAALDGHGQAIRVARQARLARGEWTDAGAGLQVRLA
jgi:hypothetical protein